MRIRIGFLIITTQSDDFKAVESATLIITRTAYIVRYSIFKWK